LPNVLLISYLFPPGAGIGSPRALSYARYLPELGCRVFVLAPRYATTAQNDPLLLSLVPAAVKVYRAFNPEVPYRFRDRLWKKVAPPRMAREVAVSESQVTWGKPWKRVLRSAIQRVASPDVQVGWAHFAASMACRLIPRHNIDSVLLNIPPYSSMKIGVRIKQLFPHVRLISDIRDDWLGYYLPLFDSAASEHKRSLAVRLERQLIECSDFVSAVTPAQRCAIRERYADQPEEKFIVTPNGYSPERFEGFSPRRHDFDGMVVTYFGSVYVNPVYSPKAYLDAIDSLPENIRRRIETRFIGRVAPEASSLLQNRQAPVRQLGFMPQTKGLRYLEESDYLLLIARDPGTHAGKLFDYLPTGKPILAVTPPGGEIARMLENTKTGWVLPEDPARLRQAILEAYERWNRGSLAVAPDREAIQAYAWPNLVAGLARQTQLCG